MVFISRPRVCLYASGQFRNRNFEAAGQRLHHPKADIFMPIFDLANENPTNPGLLTQILLSPAKFKAQSLHSIPESCSRIALHISKIACISSDTTLPIGYIANRGLCRPTSHSAQGATQWPSKQAGMDKESIDFTTHSSSLQQTVRSFFDALVHTRHLFASCHCHLFLLPIRSQG